MLTQQLFLSLLAARVTIMLKTKTKNIGTTKRQIVFQSGF